MAITCLFIAVCSARTASYCENSDLQESAALASGADAAPKRPTIATIASPRA
jgi:hypothetical protein